MTEHKALSAFEQAKLQEEVEALNLRVARMVAGLKRADHVLECSGYHKKYAERVDIQNAFADFDGQQWLLDKQAGALESAAKWFDATEYCAREHGEITAYAENELRRMASELRKQREMK